MAFQKNADKKPRNGRRIKNSEKFIEIVGPGSHIAERRKEGYYHHSLVTEVSDNNTDVKTIYYGPRVSIFFARVQEKSLSIDKMDFEQGVYLIRSDRYPQSMEEKDKAIRRARSRLGEDNYMVRCNNCEHFVNWALTGKPVSLQIEDANTSEKFGIDIIDAWYNKKSACELAEDVGQVPLKKVLTGGTVLKQLGSQSLVQPMTSTSPATNYVMSATRLSKYLTPKTKMFSDVTAMLKLDATLQSTVANVEKVLAHKVDIACTYGSLKQFALDTANMIDLNAVHTAFETTQKTIVEKAGKETVKKAATKSIQAVNKLAGTSAVAVEKVGERSIQSVGNIAAETAGKSAAAAGKETIKQAAKHAAAFAAVTTTIVETIGVGINIYKLKKACGENQISDIEFKRGVTTKISGAIGSIAGSTIGAYIGSTVGAALGQILIPVPGVGACVGSMLFGLAGKALFSGVSGFLFDRIMK